MSDYTRLNSPNVVYFTAGIGDIMKICRPIGYPYTELTEEELEETSQESYYNGFEILNTELGRFVDHSQAGNACVFYEHTQSGRQIIRYVATASTDKTIFYAVIEGIKVHDHASLYTGGPAYATYYSEVPTEES